MKLVAVTWVISVMFFQNTNHLKTVHHAKNCGQSVFLHNLNRKLLHLLFFLHLNYACHQIRSHTHCPFCNDCYKSEQNSSWVSASHNHWKKHIIFIFVFFSSIEPLRTKNCETEKQILYSHF